MYILSIGYPLFPVSPDAAGGAEQILAYIDGELVAQGHRSFVLAARGSNVSGMLIAAAAPPDRLITEEDRAAAHAEYRSILERYIRRNPVDLIHFHGLDFYNYVPETGIPMLATLHLPISWYPGGIFDLSGVQTNCVSPAQAGTRNLPVVTNGIDVDFFFPSGEKDDYLLWLGRICPEKGVHTALEVAHRLNSKLIIAGPVHPLAAHQEYFNTKVLPLLDDRRIHIGAAGREEKRTLLRAARCLLIPSTVEETSSLVAMEAISCGTPVIAQNSGALPEVIENGVTGFITHSVEEMADSVDKIPTLSVNTCRREAVRRFNVHRMAREYLALHASLMQRAGVPV